MLFCLFTDESELHVSKDQECPWWQSIRQLCSHSFHCLSAYLVAMVSRSVALETWGMLPGRCSSADNVSAKDPDADTVSMASLTSDTSPISPSADIVPCDIEAWNELVRQLEDLTYVDCFLRLIPAHQDCDRVMLNEEITVSVATMLDGGKGNSVVVYSRISKDFYTRSYSLHYFLILILEKEPVFPFFNVEC